RRRRVRRLGLLYAGGEGLGRARRGRAAPGDRHGHDRPPARRRAAADRRALHRDEGAPARLLPGGRPRPGHGPRLGGADAPDPVRHRRGAPGDQGRALAGGARGVTSPAVERAFREEWGQVVATLARRLGDLQLAEDAAQDAFAAAAARWPRDGVPAKPGAWLTVTAWRKALDHLRRDQLFAERVREQLGPAGGAVQDFTDQEETLGVEDDRLRLIFTCCHPALALEVRVALTLRYLAGLTTRQIASAFLLPEA